MLMAPSMLDSGRTTNNTVLDLKLGQMVLFMKDCILKGKNMAKENLHLQMALYIRVSFT
jgi:hypothetical protein